jgi:hypothetical protein
LSAVLVGLWCILILVAAAAVVTQSFRAWRTGAELRVFLEKSQMRLRMNGGLTLKGGSAGLPFCLNLLLALHHSRPEARGRASFLDLASILFRNAFRGRVLGGDRGDNSNRERFARGNRTETTGVSSTQQDSTHPYTEPTRGNPACPLRNQTIERCDQAGING